MDPYIYEFGTKKDDTEEPCLDESQMKQIEEVIEKYLRKKGY